MIKRPFSEPPLRLRCYDDLFAYLAFDLSLKALRHSFAITKEGQRKASLSLGGGGGVIQLPGAPVISIGWFFVVKNQIWLSFHSINRTERLNTG